MKSGCGVWSGFFFLMGYSELKQEQVQILDLAELGEPAACHGDGILGDASPRSFANPVVQGGKRDENGEMNPTMWKEEKAGRCPGFHFLLCHGSSAGYRAQHHEPQKPNCYRMSVHRAHASHKAHGTALRISCSASKLLDNPVCTKVLIFLGTGDKAALERNPCSSCTTSGLGDRSPGLTRGLESRCSSRASPWSPPALRAGSGAENPSICQRLGGGWAELSGTAIGCQTTTCQLTFLLRLPRRLARAEPEAQKTLLSRVIRRDAVTALGVFYLARWFYVNEPALSCTSKRERGKKVSLWIFVHGKIQQLRAAMRVGCWEGVGGIDRAVDPL